MPRRPDSPIRIQLGLRGWAAIAAALTILIAVPIAIAFFAIGLFVFVLPLMLLAPVFYYFKPKRDPAHYDQYGGTKKTLNSGPMIDGIFCVIDTSLPEEKSRANDNR